jgi:uncharacterized coiled-coil protein SlyX
MKKTLFAVSAVFVVTVSFLLGAGIVAPGSDLKASEVAVDAALYTDMMARIENLETSVAEQEEAEEEGASVDYSEYLSSIADSLATIAETSAQLDSMAESLGQISERLAGIEEELAWERLDEEEEADQ